MKSIISGLILLISLGLNAKTIYVDKVNGSHEFSGLSSDSAFKGIDDLKKIKFEKGDSLLFAAGQQFYGIVSINDFIGSADNMLVISSFGSNSELEYAIIDGKNHEAAIRILNSSGLKITKLHITANGGKAVTSSPGIKELRCGILFMVDKEGEFGEVQIDRVQIYDVFYHDIGFARGKDDVRTANGKQDYGWGIRVINNNVKSWMKGISISNSVIENVGHTGIKFTSKDWTSHRTTNLIIEKNQIIESGGPGIQMSGVEEVHVLRNSVNHSGSTSDSRKWGRGSGLWTWGSTDVLIEKNSFLNANGPGDSAGAHIDFNCKNIVIQYNLSMNNYGGFCEILGENYNCCYRYNISVNDGHRVKGENNAFQEGKVFWLSGYRGKNKRRDGPFNSYIYNNTIYVSKDIVAKIAVDKASKGVLIANNIFHFEGVSKLVLGDQYRPEKETSSKAPISSLTFTNNLFLAKDNWPSEVLVQPENSYYGDAGFLIESLKINDISVLRPTNIKLVKNRGIQISNILQDTIGLKIGLEVEKDILGNLIEGLPDLGAIEVE